MQQDKKPLEDFMDDLDTIMNKNKGAHEDRNKRMNCTKELLRAADDLFNSRATLQAKIKDGSFHKGICGNTGIRETNFDGEKNRPIIDLVQQGGTMLGIGLLGYTYIRERAGVRFRNMAGTSAGAINTLLIASLPEKIYAERSVFDDKRPAVKSEMLAYLVANEKFIKFLDRAGLIGSIQRFMIRNINATYKLMKVMKFVLPVILLGLSFLVYRLFHDKLFNTANHFAEGEINVYSFIIGTLSIFLIVLACLVFVMALLKKNMGINPGEEPYNWLKSILETPFVGIRTTDQLLQTRENLPSPTYVPPQPQVTEPFKKPRLVFISANLTHNRIVKFPENSGDYWNQHFNGKVSPAAYVRASMSLPFIFHAFIPDTRYVQDIPATITDTVDMRARFVDGGMLSNFPIREFHLPAGIIPRYPTFGVLLGSATPEPGKDTEETKEKFMAHSVFKYVLSFISTFRNFYDADFLRTHKEFRMLVKSVNTDRFNSLDFNMPLATKIDLFKEGAKTALDQLDEFDWDKYLKARQDNA